MEGPERDHAAVNGSTRPLGAILALAIAPVPSVYTMIHLLDADLLNAAWTAAVSAVCISYGLHAIHRMGLRSFRAAQGSAFVVWGALGSLGVVLEDPASGLPRGLFLLIWGLLAFLGFGFLHLAWSLAPLPEPVAKRFDHCLEGKPGARWAMASAEMRSGHAVTGLMVIEGYVRRPWKHRRLDADGIVELAPE